MVSPICQDDKENKLKLITLSKDQHEETWSHNYIEWGAPELTLEQYHLRESELRKQPFGYQMIPYGLINLKGDVVSFCEVYPRNILITLDGKIKEDLAYGIASVFTPLNHRKKGYAKTMIKLLAIKLKTQGAIGSFLFSDIGPQYYEELGWKVSMSLQGVVLATTSNLKLLDLKQSKEPFTPLSEIETHQLDEIIDNDRIHLLKKLETSNQNGVESFSFPLTVDIVNWFGCRSRIYSECLCLPPIYSFGVSTNDGSYLLWYHDFKDKCLFIMRMHICNRDSNTSLIKRAVEEAMFWGFDRVVVWNPNFELERVMYIEPRVDSLSSIHFFIDGVDHFEWIHNEKYCWV